MYTKMPFPVAVAAYWGSNLPPSLYVSEWEEVVWESFFSSVVAGRSVAAFGRFPEGIRRVEWDPDTGFHFSNI